MGYNLIQTFLQEAEELIADIEQSALALTSGDPSAETVNRLFRAFHTIKGSSAMCGLEAVAGFTHHVENLLDKVRGGLIPASDALTGLILKATDHIKVLLDAAQNGTAVAGDSAASLLDAIASLASTEAPSRNQCATPAAKPAVEDQRAGERTWQIDFHPNPEVLAIGGNPAALFRDLRSLGSCDVAVHTEDVPALDALRIDRCYFWWSATLRSPCDENAIRDVFIFVEEDARLEIRVIAGGAPEGQSAAGPGDRAVATPAAPADPPPAKAAPASAAQRQKPLTKEATVRVPAERLDRLVNLVGEFVMTQSCLAQAVAQTGASEFSNSVQALERLVAELRDNVLGIRMLPIGTLFGRFRRVMHDLSAELEKEAELVTEGAETELDKSILDQLGEPLIHCLRNCIDHGVEPAAERVKRGKPARATVRLSAAHTGSSVVIAIEDDGRGIDRDAVRAKAVDKHLVSPDASLSDKEIFDLILMPGFSTARDVTSVSGRGVGMDAVRRQIDFLRGSLSLESTAGKGTRVSITLPLTLAIIDGLLVQIGSERLIFPLAAVTENVELSRAERSRNNGRNVLAVRGELIPYIDLREELHIGGETPGIEKVVIVQYGGDRVGLVVERVLGAHQTVIQSLGKFYRKVEVVSGATIMGDGGVALIMDIAAVVRYADRNYRRAAPVSWTSTQPVATC